MSLPELGEFKNITRAEWAQLAQGDLKGVDPFARLGWRYDPDVEVAPYYSVAPPRHVPDLNLQLLPHVGLRGRVWHYLEPILLNNAKDANEKALAALNGSEGVLWQLPATTPPPAAKVFDGIETAYCQNAFALPAWNDVLGTFLVQLLEINTSPQGLLLFQDYNIDEIRRVMALFIGAENFRPLCFNALPLHEKGVAPSTEVAYLLSDFIEKVDSLSSDYTIKEIVTKSVFCLGLSRDYFHEIAKIRSLKLAICKAAAEFDSDKIEPSDVVIFGRPALRTYSVIDPHVNMIRATSEAMAGIIGGVNYLTIPPFDELHPFTPATFSKRITRNISNLLREESHLDKTNDPAAGSFYLETLTEKIAEAAWKKMQKAEAMGGFTKAAEAHLWATEQTGFASNEAKQAAFRKINIVGVNNFNDLDHFKEFPSPTVYAEATKDTALPVGFRFELLRLNTEEWMKNNPTQPRPSVCAILFGEKDKALVRNNFVHGFFPAAGIRVLPPVWWEETPQMPEQTTLAVLCSSDEAYLSTGIEIVKAIRAQFPHVSLAIAGNPAEKQLLKEAGVNQFIHSNSDAPQVIAFCQKILGIV